VIVLVITPSAKRVVGEAATVEVVAEGAPAVKVTVVLPVAVPCTDVTVTFAVPETMPD
jgi:hypothetical protein